MALLLSGCATTHQWALVYPPSEACAVQTKAGKCYVLSVYSEAEARKLIAPDGMTLFDHEMRHCAGWRHE